MFSFFIMRLHCAFYESELLYNQCRFLFVFFNMLFENVAYIAKACHEEFGRFNQRNRDILPRFDLNVMIEEVTGKSEPSFSTEYVFEVLPISDGFKSLISIESLIFNNQPIGHCVNMCCFVVSGSRRKCRASTRC